MNFVEMWLINAFLRPSHQSDFNIFYYRKKGEGGGQKVIIGSIISENVDNYGRPLSIKSVKKINIVYFETHRALIRSGV